MAPVRGLPIPPHHVDCYSLQNYPTFAEFDKVVGEASPVGQQVVEHEVGVAG
jgi:hypothetical protein